jgi:DNA-binding GntR family transcriptional regulator
MTGPTATSDERSPRGSKAEVAYETIRGRIVDGTFGPGHRLVLDRLAAQLGVSTVPVREALRRLEAEGYVDFKRNLGATVRQIDAADYVQTMEALAVLEATATALAAPVIDSYQVRKAQRLNEELSRALEQLDPAAYIELEQQFHEALYEACPNTYLVELIHREGARLRGITNSTFAFVPERARAAVAEHERLLELIEGRADPGRIEDFAREHRGRTAKRLLERHGLAERDRAERDQ